MANRAVLQSLGFELEDQKTSLKDTILKKFKFFGTLKNKIVSKIRKNKYDLTKAQSQELEGRFISYEHPRIEDIERELEAQWAHKIQLNENVLEALKATLNPAYDDNMRPNIDMELLQAAERTLARQMDIFEIILQQINSRNDSNKMELLNELRMAIDDKYFDLNYLIGQLVAEIQKSSENGHHFQMVTDLSENNSIPSGADKY